MPIRNKIRFDNIVGKKYFYLTVLDNIETRQSPGGRKSRYYQCICDCGNLTRVVSSYLHDGNNGRRPVKSCGCMRREVGEKNKLITANKFTTHGLSSSNEYAIYGGILSRCNNINNKGYNNYGGRGIECLWNSFEEFYNEIGPRPSPRHSIDRIDVNGNYCKENCRWATYSEQGNNRRNNKIFEVQGYIGTISEIIAKYNILIDRKSIRKRIKTGWDIQKAFFYPSDIYHDKNRSSLYNS